MGKIFRKLLPLQACKKQSEVFFKDSMTKMGPTRVVVAENQLTCERRVAERGYPRPAPSEPYVGLSIHTAQASTKTSLDTRFHNYTYSGKT
jgi:hypothetical protein